MARSLVMTHVVTEDESEPLIIDTDDPEVVSLEVDGARISVDREELLSALEWDET